MTEHDGLACSPVLVENPRTIFRCDCRHSSFSSIAIVVSRKHRKTIVFLPQDRHDVSKGLGPFQAGPSPHGWQRLFVCPFRSEDTCSVPAASATGAVRFAFCSSQEKFIRT